MRANAGATDERCLSQGGEGHIATCIDLRGKTLLDMMVRDLRALGFERLFLGCSADPKTRSHGFYRHLGWRSTGKFDAAGDEILEYFPGR